MGKSIEFLFDTKRIQCLVPFFFYIVENNNSNFEWGERIIHDGNRQVFDHWGKGNIIYLYIIRETISGSGTTTEKRKCKIIGGQMRPLDVGDEPDKERHEDHTDPRYYYIPPSQFIENIKYNYFFLASPMSNLEIDNVDIYEILGNDRLYQIKYDNNLYSAKFINVEVKERENGWYPQHIFLPIYVVPVICTQNDNDDNIRINTTEVKLWAYIEITDTIEQYEMKEGKLYDSSDKPLLIEANNNPLQIYISTSSDIKDQIIDSSNDVTKADFPFADIYIFPEEIIKQYRNDFNNDENKQNDPYVPEPEVVVDLPDLFFFRLVANRPNLMGYVAGVKFLPKKKKYIPTVGHVFNEILKVTFDFNEKEYKIIEQRSIGFGTFALFETENALDDSVEPFFYTLITGKDVKGKFGNNDMYDYDTVGIWFENRVHLCPDEVRAILTIQLKDQNDYVKVINYFDYMESMDSESNPDSDTAIDYNVYNGALIPGKHEFDDGIMCAISGLNITEWVLNNVNIHGSSKTVKNFDTRTYNFDPWYDWLDNLKPPKPGEPENIDYKNLNSNPDFAPHINDLLNKIQTANIRMASPAFIYKRIEEFSP